jgi:hypothetical protein
MGDPIRSVEFAPAFDKRDPNPAKNYGIHGVEMRFVLKGEQGAVVFEVFTNWHLPDVAKSLAGRISRDYNPFEPMGADVGYHSPTPQYEGQKVQSESCAYLDGKPCYYDGSGLAAETLLQRLIAEGDTAVWSALEERYNELFPALEAAHVR